jgi:outer membrane immunogenic protein
MKKLLLGSVALAAMIAGPAMAADMPLKAPPPVVVFSWTGCYVGGHVGGKTGRVDTTFGAVNPVVAALAVPGTAVTDDIWMSGALGGGQIGCNYQFNGGWLIGVEVDGSAVQADGQRAFQNPSPLLAPFRQQVTEHWLATARGRLGYAWDKWMVYVTGGGAWAGVEDKVFLNAFLPAGNVPTASISQQTLSGWTAGFGAEYALGYGWSIKGEYLYIDFSNKTYFGVNTLVGAEINVRLRQSVARFGMNYKFDWGGPVVAKY